MKLDPRKTALIFPGQGSQTIGMGKELAAEYPLARQTFAEADEILGINLTELMWDGPVEQLNETVNTQPALYVHSIAALRVFRNLYANFIPAAVAGHSLGEISALTAAGALSFEDGLPLVRKRGELMAYAGGIAPGSMAAILGLDIPTIEKICADASTSDEIVQVANDNCPGQVVISGAKAAVERGIKEAKAAGAKRSVLLAVSIAAHSPLMASIQDEWNQVVDACSIQDASITVIGNVKANEISTAEELRADIKAQMSSRVRWSESIVRMLNSGQKTFIETGNGSVLLGLIRRISPEASRYPLGTPSDFSNPQFI